MKRRILGASDFVTQWQVISVFEMSFARYLCIGPYIIAGYTVQQPTACAYTDMGRCVAN